MKKNNPECQNIKIQNLESVILTLKKQTVCQQIWKIKEELKEVEIELINEKYKRGNRQKTLEELFDLKQAVETLIYILYLPEHVKEYAIVHVAKMFKKFWID